MARRDPAVVSKAMRATRSHDTAPELILRRRLWRLGHRYRLRSSILGRPDLVFASARVAVFVDGDFWHGKQWKTRRFESLEAQMSRVNNSEYWISKIKRNVSRDDMVTEELTAGGWTVIRIWESDLRENPNAGVAAVQAALAGSR